jgi:hypothetical protein
MSEYPLPDPLDDFLQHPPGVPPHAKLRDEIWQQTAQMLPRPGGRRRWPIAAGVAAGIVLTVLFAYFGLTIAAARLSARLLEVEPVPKIEQAAPPPIVEPPVEEPTLPPPPQEPKPPVAARPAGALDLEWRAFDAPHDRDRVRLYRQAGDLYLDRHQDYESAVRCYRQSLHYSEASDLEFNPNDNWLVMSLKRDHRKEK